jgi:hypothetical protein
MVTKGEYSETVELADDGKDDWKSLMKQEAALPPKKKKKGKRK